MELPANPITFQIKQVEELNRRLCDLRHNVNNSLTLVVAAAELMRRKPETLETMTTTLVEQPQKILDEIQRFSSAFESAFGIQRTFFQQRIGS